MLDLVARQIVELSHATASEENNLFGYCNYDGDDDDDDFDLMTMMFVTLPVRFAPLGMPMAISG